MWEAEQELHLARIEQTLHWQQCAESYEQQIQEYYIARAQHQKSMIRLNQVLYGPAISAASSLLEGPTSCTSEPGRMELSNPHRSSDEDYIMHDDDDTELRFDQFPLQPQQNGVVYGVGPTALTSTKCEIYGLENQEHVTWNRKRARVEDSLIVREAPHSKHRCCH